MILEHDLAQAVMSLGKAWLCTYQVSKHEAMKVPWGRSRDWRFWDIDVCV